jgi:hypothetical protein
VNECNKGCAYNWRQDDQHSYTNYIPLFQNQTEYLQWIWAHVLIRPLHRVDYTDKSIRGEWENPAHVSDIAAS